MAFARRTTENAAATRTFGALRIERRVLTTPARTIAIANISSVSVGTHVTPKPKVLFWLLALLFAVMAWGSMRPDFSWGPLSPTGFTFVLGVIMLVFAGLALRPDDKTHYLLISSNDGVLSRFTAPDRAFLDEVRGILTDKINRGDEQMTFHVNFEKVQIENLAAGGEANALPLHRPNGSGQAANVGNGAGNSAGRGLVPATDPRAAKPARRLANIAQPSNGTENGTRNGTGAKAETFVDYTGVLPAIVEMHRFYARQPGTQHLEQRLSELEMLMRAGTPTASQKVRLRELTGDMTQILNAYPQAVELFDHIGSLVA
jgi:hypothetical protein